jgi:hypothetical protein
MRWVSSSMVYWADMLSTEPAPAAVAHESNALELERSVDPEDADLSWLATVPPDEAEFVESVAQEIGLEPVTSTLRMGPT